MVTKNILALDLGITSLGFAVLTEQDINRYVCVDHGVMMRDAPYDSQGNSKQSLRRGHASQRKLNEKKKRRIRQLANLFDQYGLLSVDDCNSIQRGNPIKDKWKLRAEDAFDRKLEYPELYAIFTHMAKHRGYKSIATDDLLYELERELGLIEDAIEEKETDEEKRKVYAALKRIEKLKEKYQYDTIAQVIHKAVSDRTFRSYRNHDNYEKMIRREDIEDEIEAIVAKQCTLGALPLDDTQCKAFVEALQAIITGQVLPENDSSLFGNCAYYPEEKAAPKYSYLYDLYKLYKTLADLRIDHYEVTKEDRELIADYLLSKMAKRKNIKDLKYKEIRKILKLRNDQKVFGKDDTFIINGKQSDRTLVKFSFLSEIGKFPSLITAIVGHPNSMQIFAELAEIVRFHKTPKPAYDAIISLCHAHDIPANDYEVLMLIKSKNSGTLSISHKFIIEALPYFGDGLDEDGIKEQLGINRSEDYGTFPKSLKRLHLGRKNLYEQTQNAINNHAVKSLASWILRRIADLSWRYGTFDEIIIESARDALPEKIRKEIEKSISKRTKELDEIVNQYKKEFQTVDRKMARKIKLWQQQNGLDLYTGDVINISDLFEGRADIEHIVPRSLGGINAEYNIIIAHRDSNMQKSNRLPIDWLGEDAAYINRVEKLFADHLISWKKRKNLLAKNLDETFVEVRDSKALRATSYLEALVAEVLKMHYPFPDKTHRQNGIAVRNIPGKTTSKTRAILGIKSKSRDTNFHHAEDALILASINRSWQNKLHRMLRDNYGKSEEELKKIWETNTPHIEGLTIADYIKEAYERFMSKGEENLFYRDMFGGIRSISYWINQKPLSASSHKATVYSSKHRDPNDSDKVIPAIRKSINDALRALKIVENRNKWSVDDFEKAYDKEIRQKLWLHHIGNTNDPVYRALEERAQDFISLFAQSIYQDATSDKGTDERYKETLSSLLTAPITAAGKPVYKVHFVDETFNPITMERGRGNEVLVRTDDNFLAVMFSRGEKEKLSIDKIDINSQEKLQQKNAMVVYPNEMVYLFNKNKIIHYGCLRSFMITGDGARKIALFNPRFPSFPKKQPNMFTTGSSIKSVSIGSATGVIKVHLDMTGRIKSYEKFGLIPAELEAQFLQESGYGIVENHPHH